MGRVKNLGLMRHLAALAVLFSHSFLLAEGSEKNEPFESATGEIAGIYGVFVFFIISGFLITRSCLNSSSTAGYLRNRFLRVYPAYAASIVFGLFVVCPVFASLPAGSSAHSFSIVDDLVRGLLFLDNIQLCDGARFYDSPGGMGEVINGVYWTIKIEVILYLVLVILKKFNLINPRCILGITLGATALFVADWYPNFELWGLSFGMPGFFAGSFIFLYTSKREFQRSTAIFFVFLIFLSGFLGLAPKLFPVLAAYPVLALGFLTVRDYGQRLGARDYSYGMYLFGWPVQQILRSYVGESMSGWTFFLASVPLVLVVAVFSWHFIERPCLRFKAR